jgi:hypothetical protein
MTKFVLAISILLLGALAGRGQQMSPQLLSESDKAGIIESVLELELQNQSSVPDFANIRDVSSQNIEFVEPSRLSKHGFTLLAAANLRQTKKESVVTYLLFRNISLHDGVAVVKLSRVSEGRPCFGAPFSIERTYTYETRQSSGGWVAQLTARPAPSFRWDGSALFNNR